MTKKVITASPETTVREVAGMIFDNHITGVPVVDQANKVIGIVTEYDLMSPQFKIHTSSFISFLGSLTAPANLENYTAEAEALNGVRVRDIMTREVITVQPDSGITTLVDIITTHRINPIPVVNGDNVLVGIVSRADLVKLLR